MENLITTLAIIDDHALFRQGLVSLLSESKELKIIFEAEDGTDMIRKMKTNLIPDVMLMDINMPNMNGYESTKWIKLHYPCIKVLALSMFEEEKPIIEMLKSGAGGYMLKQSKAQDLVHAIKTIHIQNFFMNELVSIRLLNNIQNPLVKSKINKGDLNSNELKFLELCCSDLTYKQIADLMNLSPFTINNYREALFEKFQTKSRTALVIYALKSGIISL
jgi:DNA-binding NarL/FixJ family response regulator